ncbi:hypothetical protein PI124_g10793 [Phytophthora idaei]|nr:hypothetical protein PI124_g10793 [Phytophthora idaei]
MTPLRTVTGRADQEVDIEVQQVVVVRLHTIPLAPDNRGPEYDPVVTYNDLVVQIDNDIVAVYRFVADICAAKFPELHSLTRVVKTIARWTVFDDNDDDMRTSAATLSFPEVNASDSFAKTELPSLTVSLEELQPPLQCTNVTPAVLLAHLNRHGA